MYRVFEALDELVAIVEEARGVPMTAGCVVPRGDVLELLDDVRDAIPSELDDAQDVLDHRDKLVGDARANAEKTVSSANAEATSTVENARDDADRLPAHLLCASALQCEPMAVLAAQCSIETPLAAGAVKEYNSLFRAKCLACCSW